ncbi:MAG: hypothetical protein HY908_16565 [Myxococcales bacterium]|nr:hypothetical protein [Myxococcales bacterium]
MGNTATTSSTTGTGGHGNTGVPCTENAECESGICLQIGQGQGVGKYCVTKCPPDCPDGSYCALINGQGYCVPERGNECTKCNGKINCLDVADACLTAPLGDKFCARDCTIEGECPAGYTCVDETLYQSGGWPAGGAGGTSAGGSGPTPTVPERFCVPDDGASCACSDKRDGVMHACENTNAFGTCSGDETCDGTLGQWQGCTAGTPAAESCNGLDDNCNGSVDEGTDAELCANAGPPPTNAEWACTAGQCARGACAAGWVAYPVPADPTAGCECNVGTGEPGNNNCAAPQLIGTVTDVAAGLTASGTLSADNDVDQYSFVTTDTNENTTNSYHVAIAFLANPNDEFQFDVVRGASCSNSPPAASSNLTTYDWCVNGSSGGVGEAPCSPTGANHCADHSSSYFVRVHRKAGATPTCAQYQLSVRANGGACTFGGQCP